MWVGVGWGRVRRAELVAVAASRWVDRAGRCCSKLLLLLLLLLSLLLAACGACCIVSQGATRQLPTSPFPRFRGCALPIGKTGGGCDEQARARCCVGAAVGFAAARRTLRWIFKLLAACLALFLFFCCCCRRGCVDASASCAATQALQRRHTGARCRAKCVCCCCRRCCCYCCCCCCCCQSLRRSHDSRVMSI